MELATSAFFAAAGGGPIGCLKEMTQITEIEFKRIERLIDQAVEGLGESLRSDVTIAKAALRKVLKDRVVFHPDHAGSGESTYLLETRLTLGDLITRANRMSVSVPDGIWHLSRWRRHNGNPSGGVKSLVV